MVLMSTPLQGSDGPHTDLHSNEDKMPADERK